MSPTMLTPDSLTAPEINGRDLLHLLAGAMFVISLTGAITLGVAHLAGAVPGWAMLLGVLGAPVGCAVQGGLAAQGCASLEGAAREGCRASGFWRGAIVASAGLLTTPWWFLHGRWEAKPARASLPSPSTKLSTQPRRVVKPAASRSPAPAPRPRQETAQGTPAPAAPSAQPAPAVVPVRAEQPAKPTAGDATVEPAQTRPAHAAATTLAFAPTTWLPVHVEVATEPQGAQPARPPAAMAVAAASQRMRARFDDPPSAPPPAHSQGLGRGMSSPDAAQGRPMPSLPAMFSRSFEDQATMLAPPRPPGSARPGRSRGRPMAGVVAGPFHVARSGRGAPTVMLHRRARAPEAE